jgi:hypothetical protein
MCCFSESVLAFSNTEPLLRMFSTFFKFLVGKPDLVVLFQLVFEIGNQVFFVFDKHQNITQRLQLATSCSSNIVQVACSFVFLSESGFI